ncbi:sensor histidine kinase [Pseudonocardia spinosispora]|uniref:sensor histidine kinase n=1 Tax=Pseudonocardia spinosispora TaxID=103441 RepID=UPI00048A7B99|nr:histidine kinase [Pseudonocardia spinosispora]
MAAAPATASPVSNVARSAGQLAADGHIELRVSAERQRIATALHDDVSQLLFAMTGRARRAQELHADDPAELLATVRLLADQLQEAQQRLRGVISGCGPTEATDTVPTATQRDLDDFTDRTGVVSHLVLHGLPEHLPAAVERVTLSCLRQALFNIERHAHASIVIVTLDYRLDRLRLVVQDDGLGLPAGFEPRVVPADGHHWGFTSMAEQVERIGGSVILRRVEEGGTQLRVELPRQPGPSPELAREAR